MNAKNELIIFVKNPVRGKVKTRLAKTMGEEKALAIYHELLAHTMEITLPLDVEKIVYYSDFIPDADPWRRAGYRQARQEGEDLGQRMHHAFEQEFKKGYGNICIIGSDCLALNSDIIVVAFDKLKEADAVIGPTVDGGYYLLGMCHLYPQLFRGKQWSASSVCADTLSDIKALNILCSVLPVLQDIDEEKDLPAAGFRFTE